MRLTSVEVASIIEVIQRQASAFKEPLVAIHLFGSRVDDHRKGGDIDLWIETSEKPKDARLLARGIRLALEDALGEQKFDLLIASLQHPETPAQEAFLNHISETRVTLWPKKT